jgi:hypothetical protein
MSQSKSTASATSLESVKTKTDTRLDATQHLFETASRLENALTLLSEYVVVFSNPESSRHDMDNAVRVIKNTINQLVSHAIAAINGAGKSLAQMATVNIINEKKERKRLRHVVRYGSIVQRLNMILWAVLDGVLMM